MSIRELFHEKRKLSQKWGQTGGNLVDINQDSIIKISPDILIKCFIHSVNNSYGNNTSWSQLGNLYIEVGKLNNSFDLLNESESALIKSKKGNRFSTYGLGELSEIRGEMIKARDYYMQTVEITSNIEKSQFKKLKAFKGLVNKLIKLGFIEDAIEVTELMKELLPDRQKFLMNVRVLFLKNQAPSVNLQL